MVEYKGYLIIGNALRVPTSQIGGARRAMFLKPLPRVLSLSNPSMALSWNPNEPLKITAWNSAKSGWTKMAAVRTVSLASQVRAPIYKVLL
jgi:hypothetical protein